MQRARQLEPPAHLYALPPIPEYEKDIDHAGLIRELNADAFKRGEAIYGYLCVNCHGTKDQPGSLPTSLRFASGVFKNGCDPYRMYQTLTKGYGMMMPQTWMVPQQKYDVIHYLREAYLKPYNATQYAAVDAEYLAQLPPGAGRGPPPENLEPWITMDYGPHLTATYEVGSDQTNFAYKGIAVRLDPGPGGVSRGSHWMLYDHDTLRVAAAWSGRGFIDWDAILFNGRHAVHPRLVGQIHLANPTGPGWADPVSGSFEDPRLRGRDNRPYGPLPRSLGALPGPVRLRQPGDPRLYGGRYRSAGNARRRDDTGRAGLYADVSNRAARSRSGPASRPACRSRRPAGGPPAGRFDCVRPRGGASGCRGGRRKVARWPSTARRMSKPPSRRSSI